MNSAMKPRDDVPLLALAVGLMVVLTSGRANAYIGPGGGLALLSTALAMLAAFSVSAMVVVTWPVRAFRRWLRRRRERRNPDGSEGGGDHSKEGQ